LDVTILMVTHDLPYALQLCERSVILSDGVIVADGPTREVLADAALMAAHRLELPFGFDPVTTRVPGTHRKVTGCPGLSWAARSMSTDSTTPMTG
jgi:cobalt/nickel transport system ATP-binding protein